MNGNNVPEPLADDAVDSGARKRTADDGTAAATAVAVYTITGPHGGQSGPCACCPPTVGSGGSQQQRRRPRTWTCGVAGGGGGSSLIRSRTFTSNYERAISSLLWQPYECRSSSNSLNDDGDVAVWLNATGRYEPLSSRSSLSLSTIPRSADSCSSSECRLLDDGGGGGGDKTPPPPSCWCTAETDSVVADDPNYGDTADATAATTGYRCPPREALSEGRAAAGERPLRSRTATSSSSSSAQSNANRPQSRIAPPRCASADDNWCCDNREDDDFYYDYDGDGVRDRVRVVRQQMNGGAQGRGGVGGTDAKPPAAERTYASTEAQTDETACSAAYREQRRRERRERRQQQQRRVHPPPPPPPALSTSALLPPPPPPLQLHASGTVTAGLDRLPDLLLNSPHQQLPPPPPLYTTVGGGGACDVTARTAADLSLLQPAVFPHPHQHHHHHHHHQPPGTPIGGAATSAGSPGSGGFRLPFGIIPARRRRSLHYCSEEDTPKSCCGLLTLPDATSTVSIRWFIGIVFIAGICSALVGTVLGATRASGREHLTVALLMIGVGVILVAISGIAWRLTAGQEASSCGAVFGLGRSLDDAAEANRRFVPRLPPSYGRPHHPYAAMMYPEFEYRAPPPSYQASMQEYRLRLLLLDRQTSMPPVTASPPPTYRSQPGTLMRGQNACCRDQSEFYLYSPPGLNAAGHLHQHQASDYSGPPSYRSRTSTLRPGCHLIMDPTAAVSVDPSAAASLVIGGGGGHHQLHHQLHHHSRDPSQLSLAASEAGGGGSITNADACGKVPPPPTDDGVAAADDVCCDGDAVVVVDEKKWTPADRRRGPAVTVVQTSADQQTPPPPPPVGAVIVTVSGAANSDATNARRETEMDILAHL